MQPIVQCLQAGAGPCLACLASHLGQSAPHLCFDRIQFSNASENMQGLGAALLLGNIVELASNMGPASRSEEHTSELQSLMRISYAGFCLKKKKTNKHTYKITSNNASTTY